MIYHAQDAEQAAILAVAQQLCVAARTAPKTCGSPDFIIMAPPVHFCQEGFCRNTHRRFFCFLCKLTLDFFTPMAYTIPQ